MMFPCQPPEKASDVDGSSTQAAPPPADQQVPTIDLAKNEPEVKKADGSLPSGVEAISKELQRKDTTQFLRANTSELEAEELEKCAVLQDDGTYKYMNKRGKLETLEEREKRLAHNSYVSFSRSFDGLLHWLSLYHLVCMEYLISGDLDLWTLVLPGLFAVVTLPRTWLPKGSASKSCW